MAAPPVNLIQDLLDDACRTEADSAAASSTASAVVMNVRMVSGMMGEMLRSAADVKNRVLESEQRVGRAAAQAQTAVERVSALGRVVEQIAATAALINEIAHQTNMLALNAAIEAARAGAAGRGFAVVAGEVKSLSKQTAQATDDVNDQLTSIRQANRTLIDAVAAVRENLAAIQEHIQAMAVAVAEEDASLNTITAFAHEAADSVEGVASTLDGIAEIARITSEKVRCLKGPEMPATP
jgi:methyl-accepting chemotaxis protein